VRQIHRRHAAATEFLPDHVPVGKDGLWLYGLGHYGTTWGKQRGAGYVVPRGAASLPTGVTMPDAVFAGGKRAGILNRLASDRIGGFL
jgi:hypothetical protein